MKNKKHLTLLICAALLVAVFSGCVKTAHEISEPTPRITAVPEATPLPLLVDTPTLVSADSAEARSALLPEDTLSLAKALPAAAWNDIPAWSGVTVPNMQQYDWPVCGQPQEFSREDIENIAELGFNFVRVPIDTRLFFDMDDPTQVRLDRLHNLDELVAWCAELGIHLCPDVHFSFGFTTDGDSSNDTMWENRAEQEIFISFWSLIAERYKDVPSNLLSFNLLNEPDRSISEEQYIALMREAIAAIREHSPERLIFVDMLSTASVPIYSLAQDKVAQSFHFYEPHLMTAGDGSWPMYNCKGAIFIVDGNCDFKFSGNFAAGTELQFAVDSIHLSGTMVVEADGEIIYEWDFGKDAVGENGCVGIGEEGTGGEYHDYDLMHKAILPADASEIRVYTEGDCYWFGLSALKLITAEKNYYFQPLDNIALLPEQTALDTFPNPNVMIGEDGTVSDDGDLFFDVVDKSYFKSRFAEYKAFSEETGVAVMMQEFGVWYEADYGDTLRYFEDLLDAANESRLSWCGWDYFGVYSFYAVNDNEMREGANYEPFSNGYMATELYDIFKSHQYK